MKSLMFAVFAASVLAAPVVSFAQSDAPVTRAQVRTELKQLEEASYNPARGEDPNYPADIQAAETRAAAQNGAPAYGGIVSGTSASGAPAISHPASADEMNKLYFGGQ
ncbi:DUF4148 domain-containing protein [Paraburkholderia sp. GAS334]|jgi:hypothetical protein|uniref:DUF4148 domain-containing protein n=1 Tax=unclassified Paraburkholderia TaxID=2615204 RepID=UPI003D1A6723